MEALQNLQVDWKHTIESDGGHCPVCSRWGKIYKRGINATMARSIIWLCHAKADADGWTDVPNNAPRWLVRSNQLPTLAWWGMVERKGNDGHNDTKHSGLWRTTDTGTKFVLSGAMVPKAVFTYNNTVEAVSPEFTAIADCFKNRFEYEEVISSYFVNEILGRAAA